MTNQEFSNEFDILYNNIMSNQAPGLNEYEKSVFLTKAQDEIIKNYFNPKGNKYQEGFDDSPKRQIDFSKLLKTLQPTPVQALNPIHLSNNVAYYAMPDDILLYVNEFLDVQKGDNATKQRLVVIPLKYSEYMIAMSKPYKRPLKNQAWRLITSGDETYTYTDYEKIASILSDNLLTGHTALDILQLINHKTLSIENDRDTRNAYLKVDDSYLTEDLKLSMFMSGGVPLGNLSMSILMCINKTISYDTTVVQVIPGPNDTITNYLVRYIRKPKPIILENLEGVTLGDDYEESPCELDSSIHSEILQRAVELAKAAYVGDVNTTIEVGKRSE